MQLGHLTLSMFVNAKAPFAHFPCLSSVVKAAESRHLLPIIADIFQDLYDPGNAEDSAIASLLHSVELFYETIKAEP